jgi:lipopolysaccharide/colanic/teichoic acid biosynthesis glycosyltransferase
VQRVERINYADMSLGPRRSSRRLFPYETTLKRVLDLTLASLGLLATIPLWLVIVVAIRLDSPGRAVFVQEGVGIQGRSFGSLKFGLI